MSAVTARISETDFMTDFIFSPGEQIYPDGQCTHILPQNDTGVNTKDGMYNKISGSESGPGRSEIYG
jgi:hypothetical protein